MTTTPTATSTETAKLRPVEHPDPEERAQRGKKARTRSPRSSHGAFSATPDRLDPVAILEEQALTRVPDLVPIRLRAHGRLAVRVLPGRGRRDRRRPGRRPEHRPEGAAVRRRPPGQLRRLRLARALDGVRHQRLRRDPPGSVRVGPQAPGRQHRDRRPQSRASIPTPAPRSSSKPSGRTATRSASSPACATSTSGTSISTWTTMMARWGRDLSAAAIKNFQTTVEKAESKDRLKAKAKLTHVVDGEIRFLSDPPLLVPVEEVFAHEDLTRLVPSIQGALRAYRRTLPGDRRHLLERYRFVQLARKVVGVGSVGTRCWVALLLGRDDDDPLFLQVKEAEASVLEPHLGQSGFANHGQRVVEGQRLMQASSDILLGWERVDGVDGRTHDYYMRQLWDWKASANLEVMEPGPHEGVRPDLRLDPGSWSRPLGRRHRHRRLPRQRRRLRRGDPRVRRVLRRSERRSTTPGWSTPSPRARCRPSRASERVRHGPFPGRADAVPALRVDGPGARVGRAPGLRATRVRRHRRADRGRGPHLGADLLPLLPGQGGRPPGAHRPAGRPPAGRTRGSSGRRAAAAIAAGRVRGGGRGRGPGARPTLDHRRRRYAERGHVGARWHPGQDPAR